MFLKDKPGIFVKHVSMMSDLKIAQAKVSMEDPHDCTDASDVLTVFNALFDTLIRRSGRRFVPHLADEWTVSGDAMTWHFKLRPHVKFHDGSTVDAHAVCANLRRLSRPDKGYTLGAPGVWHQYLGGAEFRAQSDLVVAIALKAPVADLLDILVQAFILSPACFENLDLGKWDHVIGSGPYEIDRVAPDRITVVATRAHFSGPVPHDTVTWMTCRDDRERLAMVQRGAVHVATVLPYIKDTAGLRCIAFTAPVAIIYLFNVSKGPLANRDVRRALNLAIDRAALIDEVVAGAAVPLHGFVSEAHFGAGRNAQVSPDLDGARELMRRAGYPDGLALTVSCPTRLPDEAEALTASLAGQLSAIGVSLQVTLHEDREAYAHMVRKKQIGDLAVFDSSPLSTFRVIYEKLCSRVAGSWWQGYRNAVVEGLLDDARRTPDTNAREALYQRAYHEIGQDPPWLFLYNPIRVVGVTGHPTDFEMPIDGVLDVTRVPRSTPVN